MTLKGSSVFGNGTSSCEVELSKYKQLFSAIILQAHRDKSSTSERIRKDAKRFLKSSDMERMLTYILMECE